VAAVAVKAERDLREERFLVALYSGQRLYVAYATIRHCRLQCFCVFCCSWRLPVLEDKFITSSHM
jgi:hypothetical protein